MKHTSSEGGLACMSNKMGAIIGLVVMLVIILVFITYMFQTINNSDDTVRSQSSNQSIQEQLMDD